MEDTEYCPDCDVPVVYDDDGMPLCDCEWEEVAEDAVPQEVWLAEMAADGREVRHWDPAWTTLRRGGWGSNGKCNDVFIKKATLGQLHRIERLRWRALLAIQTLWIRRYELRKEIAALSESECFIPVDPDDLAKWKKEEEAEENGEPLTEKEIARYSQPRRVHIEVDGETHHISRDDDYFLYEAPEHNGTEMEVIAAATHQGEWEQDILPARLKRASDPAKLAMGTRWRRLGQREIAQSTKCHHMNEMLALAISTVGVLPDGPEHIRKRVNVRLNGRAYPFKVNRGYVEPDYPLWPVPDDLSEIVPPEQFVLDDSLIGVREDAVQARLGEPESKDKSGWHYPAGTVVFNGKSGYYVKVVEVRQRRPAGCSR